MAELTTCPRAFVKQYVAPMDRAVALASPGRGVTSPMWGWSRSPACSATGPCVREDGCSSAKPATLTGPRTQVRPRRWCGS